MKLRVRNGCRFSCGTLLPAAGRLSVAIACMYGGLALGRVVVVSPIVASYPLFTLLTAWVFREELLTRKSVLGVLLAVSGVALISLGTAG